MGVFDFLIPRQGKYSIGITPDRATQKILDQQDGDTRALFIEFLLKSGRYQEQLVIKLVNRNSKAIAMAITSGALLELEEKKRLKISGRRKYGRDYIESLTEKGLENDASVNFFLSSYYQASGIVGRQYEIAKLRRAGINRIRLSSSHDERDCQAIAKYSGQIFDIDKVPVLPLLECDAEYCRCWIISVLE